MFRSRLLKDDSLSDIVLYEGTKYRGGKKGIRIIIITKKGLETG